MPTYAKGHVRAPNKDHLMQLSYRRHRNMLQGLRAAPLPASFDARAQGWVGPIKDQSSCGSCWDFSGTGVVEIAYNVAGVGGGPDQFILSEEYTLSCGHNGGCNGDDNTTVLEWAKKTGLPMTKDYGPYSGHAGRCAFTQSMTLYKLDDWGFADSQNGQGVTPTEDIKAVILSKGCAGCGIAADDAFMNNPAGTIFNRTTSQQIDHDVILTGWTDTATKTTATMDASLPTSVTASDGFWVLRNSWGVSFCEQGYIRIGYGVNEVGTEAVWAHINASAPPIDWYS